MLMPFSFLKLMYFIAFFFYLAYELNVHQLRKKNHYCWHCIIVSNSHLTWWFPASQ